MPELVSIYVLIVVLFTVNVNGLSVSTSTATATRFSQVNIFTIKSNFKLAIETLTPSPHKSTTPIPKCVCSDETKNEKLAAYLSASVVKARAVEMFKYYSSNRKLKSYSVLFRVQYLIKYNGQTIYKNNNLNKTIIFSSHLIKHKQQHDHYLDSSFILIENFRYSDQTGNNCYSAAEIKLNETYYLFLNNLTHKYFNHPVRLGGRIDEPLSLLRIPVFSLNAVPMLASKVNETAMYAVICDGCNVVRVKSLRKIKSVYMKQNVKIVCQLGGELASLNVLWKKNLNNTLFIRNNSKYSIETNNGYSTLSIKSVNLADQASYYCAVRDYTTLTERRFLMDKTQLVVLEPRSYALARIYTVALPSSTLTTHHPSKTIESTEDILVFKKNSPSLYVSCSAEENICWNGGTCLKTNPLLINPNTFVKKFCICKNFYEPPLCQIQLDPSQIDFAKEDPDLIPDELIHVWKSISLGRPVNLTNYRKIVNNSTKISKVNSTLTSTTITKPMPTQIVIAQTPITTHRVHHSLNNKLYSSHHINEYLLRKKKIFYKNNHI